MNQDDFYFETEANEFFDRWQANGGSASRSSLRENKKSILSVLESCLSLKGLSVLEVGCFIGDLLYVLQRDYFCNVYGVEASSKACELSSEVFELTLEHSSFLSSSMFTLDESTRARFDLIIFDDVLSWMDRKIILQVLGVADWALKPKGSIFIRDFTPSFCIAYENHHQRGHGVYNFKHSHGHRSFFLQSGMYYERYSRVYKDASLQQVSTSRPDSMTWADTLLTKSNEHLFPILEM